MADQATQEMVIAAPPERITEVLLAFDDYPRWARDIKGVTIETRDDDGRASEVAFRAAAMGRSTSYTLRYTYDLPNKIAWELVRGDIMRRLDGAYVLEPIDGGHTKVTYHLEVEVIVPLPGFVKRRAEAKIMHTALRELRAHVE